MSYFRVESKTWGCNLYVLPDAVHDCAVMIYPHQLVRYSHVMEGSRFLVRKEEIGSPDATDAF